MAFLAMTMFVSLFAFGREYFGWIDPKGWVQISLAASFIFGILCGYRIKQ